jgi:hypothetical protein
MTAARQGGAIPLRLPGEPKDLYWLRLGVCEAGRGDRRTEQEDRCAHQQELSQQSGIELTKPGKARAQRM